ncbi:MAG: hypothetical protein R2751_03845 [Bacteroidales bacterium]
MVTEAHLPLVVSENSEVLQKGPEAFDLVIVTEGASMEGLQEYVEKGGRVLFVNQAPPFGVPTMLRDVSDSRLGYAEIREPTKFPSLQEKRYLRCSGLSSRAKGLGTPYELLYEGSVKVSSKFLVYPDEEGASLTFVQSDSEAPMEFSDGTMESTNIPALITRDFGKGRIVQDPQMSRRPSTRRGIQPGSGRSLFMDTSWDLNCCMIDSSGAMPIQCGNCSG